MSFFSDYYHENLNKFLAKTISRKNRKNYIILENSLAAEEDIQGKIFQIKRSCKPATRVIVIYFNFLWKPFLDIATKLGLRKKDKREPNWLTTQDLKNLFYLEGFDFVCSGKRFLFPIRFGYISKFINQYIAQLPIINFFCLTCFMIFRLPPKEKQFSVSVIIPARNEEGNIKNIFRDLPKIGKSTELIFVEGNSRDATYATIKRYIAQNPRTKARLYKQRGVGKANAVRLGFAKAKGEVLMILDADLTVPPRDLIKFYQVLSSGKADFANGSRLIYPVEQQAMRNLNYLGNIIFSIIFTYLLGQQVKDTLCGTKALFKSDYNNISLNRRNFGDFDPFGDFDLLFGAAKMNLKIADVPVRYRQRTYGESNIKRFAHGWLLFKMTLFAASKIKFT